MLSVRLQLLLRVRHVEHEVHDVSILHDVISPFLAIFASCFDIGLRSAERQVELISAQS